MDEIKMWAIDGKQATEVSETKMIESEGLLEEILVNNPNMLMPDLTLVGRQTETEGGPLDLLGVDGDGRLVLFELKRETLTRAAVAQVIDYASDLEAMGVEGLATYIAERSGAGGIDKIEDFADLHTEKAGPDNLDALLPLRMFLVGLGVDDRTERMVNFLANKGVDISLLTFQGFEQADGKMTLARQMRVMADDAPVSIQSQPRKRTPESTLREQVRNRAGEGNLLNLLTDVCRTFLKEFDHPNEGANAYEGANRSSIVMRVQFRMSAGKYSTRALARVEPDPQQEQEGQVRIVFFEHHVKRCRENFKELLDSGEIRYTPKDYAVESPSPEIHFLVNEKEWETHKAKFSALAQSVYASGRAAWRWDIGEA